MAWARIAANRLRAGDVCWVRDARTGRMVYAQVTRVTDMGGAEVMVSGYVSDTGERWSQWVSRYATYVTYV